jgi:hypothetical protein
MSKKYSLAAAIALALASSAAGAAGVDDMFSIRGYGTLGVVHSDEDKADFVRDINTQPKGAGHSDSVSAAVDSKTALQIDMKFSERFSGVVQLVSEGLQNNTWDGDPNEMWIPSLEWANLSYRVTDNLTVRGGRIVLPFLMGAEYQKVGYANHWMRSPIELYGQIPYTSADGGDVSYKSTFGSTTNTVRAFYGGQSVRADVFETQATSYGINNTIEHGALTVRASYMGAKFTNVNANDDLTAVFESFATGADAVGVSASAKQARHLSDVFGPGYEFKTKWYGLGATFDPGSWFVMAEVIKLDAGDLIAEHTSGFVSGGMRLNKFTPYATFAMTDPKTISVSIPTAGLPQSLAGFADQMNAGFASFEDKSTGQKTISLGLRWDVASSIAVKAQYDHIAMDSGSTGLFVNQQAGFEPGGSVNVFGISADFVF